MQRRRRAAALAVLVALPVLAAADLAAAIALPRHHAHRVAAPPPTSTPVPTTSAAPATAAPTTTGPPSAEVTGTVTDAHIVRAAGDPLDMPITITIPNRGQGAFTLDGVIVLGHPGAQVAWDGGQPLPITGNGTLTLGPATLDANAGGLTWHLDGLPRYFGPGSYTARSSVAVGTGGLALAVDQVGFTVGAGSQGRLETDGNAQVHLSPRPLVVSGPGLVQLLGTLSVTTVGGTRIVHNLHAGSGQFALTFTPQAGGYSVDGTLAGPITIP